MAGRQGMQLAFGVLLARLLGPGTYGVVGLATLYVTFTTLLLDQGVSSALVQRKELPASVPGAAATLNLLSAAVLGCATFVASQGIAEFFHTPSLRDLLRVLGAGLALKGLAITPRALLSRRLDFRALAVADLCAATAGAVAGATAALLGAGPAAVLVQVLSADAVLLALLLRASGRVPLNLRLGDLRPLLPFGLRVFATNGIASFSRNTDNLLVGRYLGPASLGYYSMAYRVLALPVQLLGQTVNRVLFPVFSRIADDRAALGRALVAATEVLAMTAVPAMALVACSARQTVLLGLGPRWLPAAPLVSVLALAGARETIFYITPSLMTGTGNARLNLRYELKATALQVCGIVVGLQFGVLGVAVGYALAGLLLVPLLLGIQRSLAGVSAREQVAAVAPPVHAALWASAAYLAVTSLRLPAVVTLLAGASAYAVVLAGVLWLCHRRLAVRVIGRVARRGRGRRAARSAPTQVPVP